MLTYLSIFFFAFIEGEIYYSKVCADVVAGRLHWLPVVLLGACGGAAGDQVWFYVLRGRLHWLDRYPKLGRYRDLVSTRVRQHETGMLLISRFLPGLRVAIPVACAYAGVRPLKVSLLNLTSALAWAGAILVFVKTGAGTLSALGLNAWWGPLVPAAFVVVFFWWLGRPRK